MRDVYLDGAQIQHWKKRVMAPDEMEQVTLERSPLFAHGELHEIKICMEAE